MATSALSVLCIGGLDPCGGAGLLADARACAAFGAHCLGVATAVVAQNTQRVTSVEPIDPNFLAAQLEALLVDVEPAAVKVGMVPGIAATEVIVDYLRPLQGLVPIVVDPVFGPSNGDPFLDADAIEYLCSQLFPLATLVTPNALEAAQLTSLPITSFGDMASACVAITGRTGVAAVLLKGGHMVGDGPDQIPMATDLLFDGKTFTELSAPRIGAFEVRGTGCLLASAVASLLADDRGLIESAQAAKVWLSRKYALAQVVGRGQRIAVI